MTHIILHDELLEAFPLRSRKREGCPLSPLTLHILLNCKVPNSLKIQVKVIRGANVEKKEVTCIYVQTI